jgi:hypothetical protein
MTKKMQIILSIIILNLSFGYAQAQQLTKKNVNSFVIYSNAVVAYYNHHIDFMNNFGAVVYGAQESYSNGEVSGNLSNPDDVAENPDYQEGATPLKYSALLAPNEKSLNTKNLEYCIKNYMLMKKLLKTLKMEERLANKCLQN